MRSSILLSGFFCAILCAGFARADQLSNGGFETPVLSPNSFVTISPGNEPSGFVWTVPSGNIDIASLPIPAFTINFPAFSGAQIVDLNGNSTGSLLQTFPTVAGQTYTLSFAYADNPVALGVASAGITVSDATTFAPLLADAIVHSTSTGNNADWQIYSNTFVATGTSSRLNFLSTSTDTGASGGIFLDAASVNLVPEPGSAAVIVIVSALCRRRVR